MDSNPNTQPTPDPPSHPARAEARRLARAWYAADAAGARRTDLDAIEAEWGEAELAAARLDV